MADLADLSDAEIDAHIERALAAHRAAVLRDEIDPALPAGAPRDCLDCGMPVPAERLAAAPHARRCFECQMMAEVAGWL
jgi:RNA polymerase-binding transcription factor DksA